MRNPQVDDPGVLCCPDWWAAGARQPHHRSPANYRWASRPGAPGRPGGASPARGGRRCRRGPGGARRSAYGESRSTARTPAMCLSPTRREAARERTPPRLLVRVLNPEPRHRPTSRTTRLFRRLLARAGRPLDSHRTAHDQPSTRHRSLRAGVGVAARRAQRHQASTTPSGTLRSHRRPGRHTHHMDSSPSHLPTGRTPAGHRTSSPMRPTELQLSLLVQSTRLRSAGRASRLWLRPRSCLRPARRCRRRRAPTCG